MARESEWKSIQDLLYRKWFTRLWIYQEIILTRVAVVTVGLSEMEWTAFMSALWRIFIQSARLPSLSALLDSEYIDNYVRPILSSSTAIDFDAIQFLQFSKYASCADPKDRIYAMLNLTSLGVLRQNLEIIPDYSKTKEQVYHNFVQRYIITLGSLNMLNLCKLQNLSPNLPSWVPDLSIISYKPPLSKTDASGRSEACAYFPAAGNCLHLPLDLCGVYDGGGSMLDAFVKTLFCGQTKEDQPPTTGDIPTLENGRNVVLSFLCDPRIAKGDNNFLYQILVALGSKTPLLLRRLPDQKDTYRLVGGCYVAGLVDGEALLDANRVYMHEGTDLMLMDPRLGPLPENWQIRYFRGRESDEDGDLADFEFENKESGVVTWTDPRLTKETLVERGLDMREFILV
ncbi:hypothetical protein V8E51_007279 [Hyaloscypha variabilis]